MALIFGGVLGLAQLAKFTSLLLYPIAIASSSVIISLARSEIRRWHEERICRESKARTETSERPRSIGRLCGLWVLAFGGEPAGPECRLPVSRVVFAV